MLNCFQVAVTQKFEVNGERKKQKGDDLEVSICSVFLFQELRHVHPSLFHFTV